MAPIKDKLAELASVSAALNVSTDSLNSTIEALEQQLAEMRIGVCVELDDLIDEKRPAFDFGLDRKIIRGWRLGYGKIEGTWCITVIRGYLETEESETWEFVDEGEPLPLKKASRRVRAEAICNFEELVSALTEKVGCYAQLVEKANGICSLYGDSTRKETEEIGTLCAEPPWPTAS